MPMSAQTVTRAGEPGRSDERASLRQIARVSKVLHTAQNGRVT